MVVFPLGLNSGRICMRKSRCPASVPHLWQTLCSFRDMAPWAGMSSVAVLALGSRNTISSPVHSAIWWERLPTSGQSLGASPSLVWCNKICTPYNSTFIKLFSCEFSGVNSVFYQTLPCTKKQRKSSVATRSLSGIYLQESYFYFSMKWE